MELVVFPVGYRSFSQRSLERTETQGGESGVVFDGPVLDLTDLLRGIHGGVILGDYERLRSLVVDSEAFLYPVAVVFSETVLVPWITGWG